jgi:hypothetical protein
MRNGLKIVVAFVIVFLAASACFAGDVKYSGFLGDYYKELQPGPKDGAKMRWFKPGVNFTKYNKVMLDSVIFYYADNSEDKGIDGNEMKDLSDSFNLAIVNAMKDKYPIVSEPAPDVLRLRVAITNIKKSRPVQSAISSVIPVGIGISILKKGATGAWSGSGSTSVEVMGLDSASNEVITAAYDEKSAEFEDRFTRLGSAKEAFKYWSERIRIMMDRAHQFDGK